jgi:hypothetical protein
MSVPKNFYEYLQTLPADSEIHAAGERFGRALENLQGTGPLFVELKTAATALRSLLQDSAGSQLAVVAEYASTLAADAALAGVIANCPLVKDFFK